MKSLPYTINFSYRKKGMGKIHKNSYTAMFELFLFFSWSSGLCEMLWEAELYFPKEMTTLRKQSLTRTKLTRYPCSPSCASYPRHAAPDTLPSTRQYPSLLLPHPRSLFFFFKNVLGVSVWWMLSRDERPWTPTSSQTSKAGGNWNEQWEIREWDPAHNTG